MSSQQLGGIAAVLDCLATPTATLLFVGAATVGCWKRLYRAWMLEDRPARPSA